MERFGLKVDALDGLRRGSTPRQGTHQPNKGGSMSKPEFLVWVDDSPVIPEEPLTAKQAIKWFKHYLDEGEENVEIRVAEEWS